MGNASPRSSQCTRALSSPATKWFGVARICTSGRGSTPRRSSSARCTATSSRSAPRSTHTRTSVAPMARAASSAPSSTRCGDDASRKRSLALAGSPSVPFDHHDGRRRATSSAHGACAAVGKPAPPRPRRPAASTSSTSERARPSAASGCWYVDRCASSDSGAPVGSSNRRAGGPHPRAAVGLRRPRDGRVRSCSRPAPGQRPRPVAPPRPRRRTCAGSRGRAATPGTRQVTVTPTQHHAGGVERQHPGLTSVGADEEAVHHGDRPAHVGEPVHQPPRRERQAGPQRAR